MAQFSQKRHTPSSDIYSKTSVDPHERIRIDFVCSEPYRNGAHGRDIGDSARYRPSSTEGGDMQRQAQRTRKAIIATLALLTLVTWVWGCSGDDPSTTDIAASTNTAPVINSVTASPNSVSRGGTTHIIVMADDAENDQLDYTYVPTGGTVEADGNTAVWMAPTEPGKYTLTVKISDGRLTSQAWVSIIVFIPLTTITGALVLPTGETGDLAGTDVILRAGATDLANDSLVRYVPADGTGPRVTYTISDVMPGSYYLAAWKDIDRDGRVSTGDFYGCFGAAGCPAEGLPTLTVAEGETRFIQLTLAVVPADPDDDIADWDRQDGGKGGPGDGYDEITNAEEPF
jgi:hypothetical protein